jgi:integration host factor subunit beta
MEFGNERAVMKQSDLIFILMEKENLTRQEAESVVKLHYTEFKRALQKGDRIEIRGFGVFTMRTYAPYKARNPKSGKKVDVPAKKLPYFKVGKELRDRIDSKV